MMLVRFIELKITIIKQIENMLYNSFKKKYGNDVLWIMVNWTFIIFPLYYPKTWKVRAKVDQILLLKRYSVLIHMYHTEKVDMYEDFKT